jgi:hypothetical protein
VHSASVEPFLSAHRNQVISRPAYIEPDCQDPLRRCGRHQQTAPTRRRIQVGNGVSMITTAAADRAGATAHPTDPVVAR